MFDAITTAQGKPESPLKAVFIGTIAPAADGSWWPELIAAGSVGTTYVQALQGDADTWDKWSTIRKCNPLSTFPEMRAKLLEERDSARRDTRLKSRFMSYRLNLPSRDESEMLLTVDDWAIGEGREVQPRADRPIVAVDLGGGRSWSAAVAIWESGRIEAMAVAPGIPSLEDQERRDSVPSGMYQRLHDAGILAVAEGLRVQPPAQLWDSIVEEWGTPVRLLCDRFRLG